MLLQSVRPNIVQSIRAYRPEDLQQAAQAAGQHFLYTNLSEAQNKQDVLDIIARDFLFPDHFGKNLDALYDCMTDLVHKSGPQPGFVEPRGPDRARVERVWLARDLDEQDQVSDRAGHGPQLVHGPAEAVADAADAPEGRLEPEHPAQRRGHAYRAIGVGRQRERYQPRRHSGGRSAR